MSLAGPKMIWQFGELGYDISIDQNGRVGKKPILWQYLDDPERKKLFDVYSAMLQLRAQFDVFTSGTETLSVNGAFKKIQLNLNDHNINLLGNFGTTDQTVVSGFQHPGTWYEFFTGAELTVSDVSATILLKAGEFRLYSDQKLPAFNVLTTNTSGELTNSGIRIFPNPASDKLYVEAQDIIQQIELISADGRILRKFQPNTTSFSFELNGFKTGLFFARIKTPHQIYTEKIIKN